MAFDTFSAAWKPKWGANLARKSALHEAKFGDQYTQTSRDGINNNPEVWSLSWETDGATATEIEEWIVDHDDVPFKWTNPKGVLIQVRCPGEVGHTWDDYGTHTVTATFKQDWSPEV